MKLLLHTCCGPCFLGVWEGLGKEDLEVTGYFYNPNIFPKEEHDKRLENLFIATKDRVEIVAVDYDSDSYENMISTVDPAVVLQEGGERCLGCYRLRLLATAKYAKENGFDAFSTTLLVSPYQQHDDLRAIGMEIGAEVGIEFYYADWRPYFRQGQDEARFIPIYRQKYCGCRFSFRGKNNT